MQKNKIKTPLLCFHDVNHFHSAHKNSRIEALAFLVRFICCLRTAVKKCAAASQQLNLIICDF